MNSDHSFPSDGINKWQRMLDIVSQNASILQPDLSRQFKKMFIIRLFIENSLTFLLQYMGLMLIGTLMPQAIAPLWFASGSACAFIFMRGSSVLPGILLGSFFAYFLTTNSVYYSCFSAAIDGAQAYLLLWITRRYISPSLIFDTLLKFAGFVISCGMLTVVASVLHALPYYAVLGDGRMLQWWLGNLDAILIFSCAIVTWDLYFPQIDSLMQSNKSTLIYCYALLGINVIALLLSATPLLTLCLSICTLPLMLFTCLRFGWCGIMAALFLFGLLVNLSAYLGAPIFTTNFSSETLTFLQMLLLIEAVAGMSLAIHRKQATG